MTGSTLRLTVLRCVPYAYHEPHPFGARQRYDWVDLGSQHFTFVLRPLTFGHANHLPSGPTALLFALLANYYAASGVGDLSVVLLLALVLLARPQGLSGRTA